MLQAGDVTIDSPPPLGEGTLVLRAMRGSEGLSTCFEYALLVDSSADLDAGDLLGVATAVHVQTKAGPRHFHGTITSIEYLGAREGGRYRLLLRPWLWLLAHRVNSRIFQNQNVIDILTSVFTDLGFQDYDTSSLTTGKYKPREYVVQYRETDLHFVSRLMEREGVYYYFQHEADRHVLVLVDSSSAHEYPASEDGSDGFTVPYRPSDAHRDALIEYVDSWRTQFAVQPGAYAHADYDFTQSRAKLYATRSNAPGYANDALEVYDYPGGFRDSDDGEAYAIVRLEQRQVGLAVASGSTNARGLTVGALFTLADHPLDDQNGDYLVTSAVYRMHGQNTEGEGGSGPVFGCAFTAIEAARQFRPPAMLEKPLVTGPQTAIVVGPAGEEIWTDKFGRVKVQFHWDRDGKNDEKSSCFVRVSQAWAGSQYGAIHIPRIGQEVIVDFFEGDPDQPIITGRVYNDANMPPYPLPDHQTQSGIKTRSTKGANITNFNEIRFEDLKGKEELHLQAEREMSTLVKASQSLSVGANRAVSVGADETISIGANRALTVGKDEIETFKGARTMTVAKTESETVQQKHTGAYHGGRDVSVDGADETLTVSGVNMVTTVHGEYNVTADTQLWITQNGDSLLMKDKFDLSSAGPITLSNDQCSVELKGGKITLLAANEITLQCGSASITLKKSGAVVISGSQKVSLSGGQSAIELADAGATLSGPKATVSGAGSTEITGPVVKIN